MAWGMGLPLLAVGASAGSLLPKAGAWMDGVKAFFGVLLFATAWWMLTPVLPEWLQIAGWSVLAVLSAVLLGAFDRLPEGISLGAAIRKTIGLLLALLAIVWVIGLASGGRSLLQPLAHLGMSALPSTTASVPATNKPKFERVSSVTELEQRVVASDRPVMLDFYADWCVSCIEMETFTFSNPLVAQRMSQMLLLKADVTANSPQDRALLKRFNLFGPPGIVFFEPGGRELKDIRVIGFQDAERFSQTLDQVLGR
jgi:thiol:disulfide interchange protein DsbD